MEKKFKAGDFARIKSDGKIVKVTLEDYGWVAYEEEKLTKDACPMEEVEPVDNKTAFLSELKGLLEKYNAKMSTDVSGPDLDCAEIDMLFVIGDDEIRFDVSMFNSFITPDNIIESACYDKE